MEMKTEIIFFSVTFFDPMESLKNKRTTIPFLNEKIALQYIETDEILIFPQARFQGISNSK
jgi:hypothetical protein